MVGVEKRLKMLLWALAERWGRVDNGAVHLPVRLSHQDLAHLVGARRPTVTSALGKLREAGALEETSSGWRLSGQSPAPPA